MKRPPSCKDCTKTPTTYITLGAGGIVTTCACCQDCPAFPLNSILPSYTLGIKVNVPSPGNQSKCPDCGFRWIDFDRIHRFGCPSCYNIHGPKILAVIAQFQPNIEHLGKRPYDPKIDTETRLTHAHSKLKEALHCEDFESAAILRDLIADFENKKKTKRKPKKSE